MSANHSAPKTDFGSELETSDALELTRDLGQQILNHARELSSSIVNRVRQLVGNEGFATDDTDSGHYSRDCNSSS